ncbi:MAG TPA: XRE family transcriptional regulator [Vicinamibacteria bacterium]|jgi:Zn-dependent peptidase ImmA (M78 family)/transcriptional regulator with XRE-family HTH domain|nr:XRE family transcriptional regulator [Vicinamibacteria bacterium]
MESNEAVGQRIAKAREFLGLTQAVVAEKLGLARTTQVAIEQGRRPVSVAELYKYSEVLSRPLDYFLGLGVWGKADFRPHFRLMAEKLDASVVGPPRRPGRPKGAPEASPEKLLLMNFESLCRNYLELEETNGLPRTAMPELPVPRLFSVPEAEQLAATVRAHLDIGPDAPIRDLRVRLEDTFAIRVYVLSQRGRLSAGAFHHPAIGGSVLLSERSIPRMRFTLARALGHLLASREEAMVDLQEAKKKAPIETFSSAFAAALLMPSRGLRERFGAVHSEANEVSDIAILFLARTFGVTLKALRVRLEALKLVSTATLKRIDEAIRQAGAGARSEPAAVQQELPDQPRWEMLPERYVFLAMRAYRKELISRARLAECLCTTENDTAVRLLRYVASVAELTQEDEPETSRTT